MHAVSVRRVFKTVALTALVLMTLLVSACGEAEGEKGGGVGNHDATTPAPGLRTMDTSAAGMSLTSDDVGSGGEIARAIACGRLGGDNRSPQLSWNGAPEGTAGYAVVMDDEDPPCGTGADACRHWALFNIPAAVTTLDAGVDPDVIEGVTIGMAYDGKQGYAGPCPPSRHTYSITVFALDAQLPSLPAGLAVTRSSFREEYGGHILDEATLTGWFSP